MVSSWFNSRLLKYQFWLKLHFLIKGLEILKIEFVLDLARLIIIRCRYLYLRKYIYVHNILHLVNTNKILKKMKCMTREITGIF